MQHSADGTIKFRFKTHDGHLVEGVLIPTALQRLLPAFLHRSVVHSVVNFVPPVIWTGKETLILMKYMTR